MASFSVPSFKLPTTGVGEYFQPNGTTFNPPPAHLEELYPPCLDNKGTLCVYAWSTKRTALEVVHVFLRAGFRDVATKLNCPMYTVYTSNHGAIKVCFDNPLDASLLYECSWQTGAEAIVFTGYHDAMRSDDLFPKASFIHRLGLGPPSEPRELTVKLIGLPSLYRDKATMRQIISGLRGPLVKVLLRRTSVSHFVKARFGGRTAVPEYFALLTPSYRSTDDINVISIEVVDQAARARAMDGLD